MEGLHIETKMENGVTTLFLEGDLDVNTSPLLSDTLMPCIDKGASVCLDLAALRYISSAGLRVLLSALKRARAAGTALSLRSLSAENRSIMQTTGFLEHFDIL